LTNSPSPPPPEPSRRGRLSWIVALIVAIIAFLYFVPGLFVAYTEDAYVRSDFVEIAPEVAGVIDHVDTANDQKVSVGAVLTTINPQPFQLAVDLKQRRVDAAMSVAKVKQDETRGLAAALETAKAAVTLTQTDYDRVATLVKDQAVSQADLDSSTDRRQKARDAVAEVEAKMRVDAAEAAVAFADVDTAKAELSLARYNLSRTRLVAPVQGFVTNLSLRPGDYASPGVPLVGLVDDTQWRVVANFKEYVAARLSPGKRAWVWLDSHPWRFYPARVFGVGRGVARNEDARRLLPYVAPTTDWIRLSRRLQVTLRFDPQPDVPLFMGADARVLIFF
jgi:membrane fusion protein, multidrug efflux system